MNDNKKHKNDSIWTQAFKLLLKNKLAMTGLIILIVMFIFCFIGPLFSPYSSGKVDSTMMLKPPNAKHLLGTDSLGRDILTRLMQGGRISLTIGIVSMIVSITLGAVLGLISGFYGKLVDGVLMRIADILMSIPSLPLLMIMGAILSEWKMPTQYRLYVVMLMLSFISWPGLARMVRGQVLSLREESYMMAADVLGLKDSKKIFHHLLPNIIPLLIVVATLGVAGSILSESALSYLGLGVIPPTPSWGNMIAAANNMVDFQKRPWLWIPPGLAILVTVICINLLGDGLRDAFDPKMKGR